MRAFNAFIYPPPFLPGLPCTPALAEDANFWVGYVMYPTLWGIDISLE